MQCHMLFESSGDEALLIADPKNFLMDNSTKSDRLCSYVFYNVTRSQLTELFELFFK